MIPPDILPEFEAAYFGSLPVEDAQALEQRLRSHPEWQEELKAYHELWAGLEALREETLQTQFADWEADVASNDEVELLEWYFQGQLSPVNQAYVTKKQADDPAFAARFAQCQKLFGGLETLGENSFRARMLSWDEEVEKPPVVADSKGKVVQFSRFWRPLAIAASVLVIIVAGLLLSEQGPNPQALLDELYTYPVTGATLGADQMEQAEYLAAFDAAHQAFQGQDYVQAATAFTNLSAAVPPESLSEDDIRYYQDNIEWMVVLARFGAGETEGDFSLRLQSIADNAQHRFQTQAQQLQAKR